MIIKNKKTGNYQIINHTKKNSIVEICNLQYNKMIGYQKEKYLVNMIKNKIKKEYGKQ
jgi:hypothetical protein